MTPSSKATPYHRFIPREEVQEVEAWSFDDMGPPGVRRRGKPGDEPPELPSVEVERMRQQAYADGFEQGKLAGAVDARAQLEAPMKRQAQDQARRLEAVLRAAHDELEQLQAGMATELLHLACEIARQVVRHEIRQAPEGVRAVVQEALATAVSDGQPATVRLNPQDLVLLQDGMAEGDWPARLRWVADAQITPGGCIVETAHGSVDGTVERRWARAVGNLGLDLPWQQPPADVGD